LKIFLLPIRKSRQIEIGPFFSKEITNLIKRKYEKDGDIVDFKVYKLLTTDEELKNQEETLVKTINIES